MTDNRDIDEILASLDALLREGDSHNDDASTKTTEYTSNLENTDDLEVVLEADMTPLESSEVEFFNVDTDEAGDEAYHDATLQGDVIGLDEASDVQEIAMPRVVLTEDMMLENPQVSLPLDFSSEQEDVSDREGEVSQKEESEPIASEGLSSSSVMHLHKQEVEQLLTLVTEDVSQRLQEILPTLMKSSLHAHLADMQHELDENNKTSDDE